MDLVIVRREKLRHKGVASMSLVMLVVVAMAVVVMQQEDQGHVTELTGSASRRLVGARLPAFTPAALALAPVEKKELSKHEKEVDGILKEEKRRQAERNNSSSTGPALSKKDLAKIEAAARAAAEKNNKLLEDADKQLEASQEELGGNAVNVPLLSSRRNARWHPAHKSLSSYVAMAMKDKDARKAYSSAKQAAERNKKLMEEAGEMLQHSAEELGRDAVSLPSLGKPLGGKPSPLYEKVVGRSKRMEKEEKRGGGGSRDTSAWALFYGNQGRGGGGGGGGGGRQQVRRSLGDIYSGLEEANSQQGSDEGVESRFLKATALARVF